MEQARKDIRERLLGRLDSRAYEYKEAYRIFNNPRGGLPFTDFARGVRDRLGLSHLSTDALRELFDSLDSAGAARGGPASDCSRLTPALPPFPLSRVLVVVVMVVATAAQGTDCCPFSSSCKASSLGTTRTRGGRSLTRRRGGGTSSSSRKRWCGSGPCPGLGTGLGGMTLGVATPVSGAIGPVPALAPHVRAERRADAGPGAREGRLARRRGA